MNDERTSSTQAQSNHNTELEDIDFSLIAHISKQNRARAAYLSGIEFGEPIWDFLLELLVSEYLNISSSSREISKRLETSEAITQRCAEYLLDKQAIFKNQNQYTATDFPWLVSDETKIRVKQWLNGCISESPVC